MKNYKKKNKNQEKFQRRKLNNLQFNMKNKLNQFIKIQQKKLLLIMIFMNLEFETFIMKSYKQ